MRKIEYMISFIMLVLKNTVVWLPFVSVFILIGSLAYAYEQHIVAYIIWSVIMLFILLKTWADGEYNRFP